jgi:molybdopterin-guanine dinucleotide biosynthesis protein A
MQAAGFVLVGGRSSRMGRDKALLRWNSHALVEEVAVKVRSVAGNVALVGPPERYCELGFPCLADVRPGFGPLAGIEAALASGRAELNLIAACDMPGMDLEWLRRLLRGAEQTGAQCTVIRDLEGVVHPLCGVYRHECLPAIRRALDEHRLRLQDVTRELQAAVVEIEGPLVNLNTPQEWMAWQRKRAAVATGDVD